MKSTAAFFLALLMTVTLGAQNASQLVNLRHWSGQAIAPVYEGFDVNADGSYNMWFGYMNRNYEEEIDLPVGADNTFEPGGDRGQPTHFVPRRHKDVFSVRVPKDFGDKTLVWKLNSHGQPQQVIATLKPVWQIDRLRTTRGGNSENVSSNLPPEVNVFVSNKTDTTATLTVIAKDDGLPKRRGEPIGMTVLWAKYRGPGDVTFSDREIKLVDGRATATATFSAPGEYILQSVVDDGSGESAGNFGYHCCWTNTQAKITVKGDGTQVTRHTSQVLPRRRSRRTSRRSFRRAARPAITKARPRRCRSSPTNRCGHGRDRSGSAWPRATCHRGTWTRPSASATTRTTDRCRTGKSPPSSAGSTTARRRAIRPTCRRRSPSARKATGS